MSPAVKRFKVEYAAQLFSIAKGDLDSAKVLRKHLDEGRQENIIYLCQQAVEKSIKAALCFRGIPILQSHDLDALVAGLSQTDLPPNADKLGVLTQYASIRRYEEGHEIVEPKDLDEVLNLAQNVIAWCKAILSSPTKK